LARFAEAWSHFLQRTGAYVNGANFLQRAGSYLAESQFTRRARAYLARLLRGAPDAPEEAGLQETAASALIIREAADPIAPLRIDQRHTNREGWAARLTVFLRAVAVLSLVKGLYHWAVICGFGATPGDGFETQNPPWQMATVFFAIIDLTAAVGLWIGAAWGVIIWLASSVTMIVVHALLPQIYGFQPVIIVWEIVLIVGYVFVALGAAREQRE
jgi:hypothetical protein